VIASLPALVTVLLQSPVLQPNCHIPLQFVVIFPVPAQEIPPISLLKTDEIFLGPPSGLFSVEQNASTSKLRFPPRLARVMQMRGQLSLYQAEQCRFALSITCH
jgi:hypothetical protein